MRRTIACALCACLLAVLFALAGCSGSSASSNASADLASTAESSVGTAQSSSAAADAALPDGRYTVDVKTDSSMFHLNEATGGKGELTVDGGQMTVHISLTSKKIVNVYPGTLEQAQADEAGVLQPTCDTMTYSDGYEEEVYGFDIPVPALDQEFAVAILGSKGKWYDHKVIVSNPMAEK